MKNPNLPFPADPGIVQGKDYDLGYRNSKGQNNAIRGHEDRSRFIIKEIINVYPDNYMNHLSARNHLSELNKFEWLSSDHPHLSIDSSIYPDNVKEIIKEFISS